MFADGSKVKHFAIVSNLWELKPGRLIEWHREKAGTIEGVHDVVKNELAGGVMPSKYFGANAAWLRLAVISHNVLTALKRLALPPELVRARPKRLRFLIFNTAGRLVHHARQLMLRLAAATEKIAAWGKPWNFCRYLAEGPRRALVILSTDYHAPFLTAAVNPCPAEPRASADRVSGEL